MNKVGKKEMKERLIFPQTKVRKFINTHISWECLYCKTLKGALQAEMKGQYLVTLKTSKYKTGKAILN